MTSLSCTAALHAALTTSPEFSRCKFIGYQQLPASDQEPADVIELRRCAACGSTLGRELGIGARLERARKAHGGDGDQPMIGRCKRALSGDEGAILSYLETIAFESLMPRAKTDPLPAGWRPVAAIEPGLEPPALSPAMRDESLTETQRIRPIRVTL